MKLRKQERKPRTKGKPERLSIEATGLLAHAWEYRDSDGKFSWGILKTAEFFGVSKNTMSRFFDELEEAGDFGVIQSGKDPVTGRNLLKIVRPRRGKNPGLQITLESSPTKDGGSPVSTPEVESRVTCDPHSIGSSPTDVVSAIKGSVYMSTAVSRVTDNPGLSDPRTQPTPPALTKEEVARLIRLNKAGLDGEAS